MDGLRGYKNIWVFDTEYLADPGEIPEPVCLAAVEIFTGRWVKLWRGEMNIDCPFDTGPESLFVCFSGVGDISVFETVGWPVPERLVDLFPEVRAQLYDRATHVQTSLLNACKLLRIDSMESSAKDAARDLIINRLFTDEDKDFILDYCAQDVTVTATLFESMYGTLTQSLNHWNGVLLRGRYTIALSRMERTGIPLDIATLSKCIKHWETIKTELVSRVDTGDVYDGVSFKEFRFSELLNKLQIPWPRTEAGGLKLDDETFRQEAKKYGGVIANIREVRYALGKMRLSAYTIGTDGRNRIYFNPYGSVTSRNQPSNSKFIFGSSRWVREFIQAPAGWAICYADWSSQEIGIAGALSGDMALWSDYQAGDIYLAFAKRAGLVPPEGTKSSHSKERDQCKAVVLGLSYGLTEHGLSEQLGISRDEARHLILLHKEAYRQFHKWADEVANRASMGFPLRTPFGWERRLKQGSRSNLRSLRNFLMQGTGADMMRLACSMLTESGIKVCCPVHDAVLVLLPVSDLRGQAAKVSEIMEQASEAVLGTGFRVRCPVLVDPPEDGLPDVFPHPQNYRDAKAGDMYRTVVQLAEEAEVAAENRKLSSTTLDNDA